MAESQGRGAEMLFAMRLLAVIGEELAGYETGGEWAILSGLVAANEPASVDVHVLALITPTKPSFWFGNPLGRALAGSGGGSTPRAGYDAAGSARQRLDRALTYLHGLGLRADGDLATGRAFAAVRREVVSGGYDRVLVLSHRRRADRWLLARLRRSLPIPVEGPSEPPPEQ